MAPLNHDQVKKAIQKRWPEARDIATISDRLQYEDPFSEYSATTDRPWVFLFFSYDPTTSTIDRNDYAGNRLETLIIARAGT